LGESGGKEKRNEVEKFTIKGLPGKGLSGTIEPLLFFGTGGHNHDLGDEVIVNLRGWPDIKKKKKKKKKTN